METLPPKEQKVFEGFVKRLKVPKKKTAKPCVIGMVGLVGAGKLAVAETLARALGAVVIDADDIRVLLRKNGLSYNRAGDVVLAACDFVLGHEGSAVIVSDFVDPEKRNQLKKVAKDREVPVFLVRMKCEPDVMFGRIIDGKYPKTSLFGGAETMVSGKSRGASVKLRELWRRTPQHYSWMQDGGGKWVLKSMPFVFEEIDTTDSKKMKAQVAALVRDIMRQTA